MGRCGILTFNFLYNTPVFKHKVVPDYSTLRVEEVDADIPMDVDPSGLVTSKSPASVIESSEQNELITV